MDLGVRWRRILLDKEVDLYKHLKPALRTKTRELNRAGFEHIKEDDVWNYMVEVKWREYSTRNMSALVDDILHVDEILIDNHFKSKLANKE